MGNVQRLTIVGEKKQGRVKMINFNIMNKALHVAWIPHLQSRSDASWKITPDAKSWRNIIPFTM